MMIRMVMLLWGIGTIVVAFGHSQYDAEDAIRSGALGKYVYRVIGDDGSIVTGAVAHVVFKSYGRPQDNVTMQMKTDADGEFVVTHRFNGSVTVVVEKDGYYISKDVINYMGMESLPVKDGKWQPYGAKRKIVLKKIRKPVELFGFRHGCQISYPPFDQWVGFDLVMLDWCAPVGKGEKKDMLIRFAKQVVPGGYVKTMDVCFTNNPFAGVYKMKKETGSDFKTEYRANTNGEYSAFLSYRLEKTSKGIHQETLGDNEYLVFRTRTKIDEDGFLVDAHYGVVGGGWRFFEKGGMKIRQLLFNTNSNDSNIEDAQISKQMMSILDGRHENRQK